ncbi:carbohydrate ABC transporter permease [Alicyclobacillus sp. SO9]|uniref:carbohydrate ABC transporter permease n=1 Tax=Alicyclobacillus sp. SO9 TaxID=2665646 RepID=UPI0018E764A8|nr:sugar ABC transporter permease [Alicyclobacillus sp. SO9]QQE77948.1 sugar ABC transporter permease [Alicyclobacillus sp. SO9]
MSALESDIRPVGQRTVKKKYFSFRGYGMLLPAFLLMLVFSYYPPIMAIIFSFSHWDGFNPPAFNGLQNYISVLTDHLFWISMFHLGVWSFFKLILEISIPLIVAVVIYHLKSERARYIYRVLFVIPMVVPMIVQLMVWSFIYSPQIGMLDTFLKDIGLGMLTQNWLGAPHIALYSLVFVGFPFVIPFNLLIFYAGLQNIPDSVFEASRLDGVSRIRRFFTIEVPLVLGQIKLLMILTIIGLLQNIALPLVLTNGGPGYSTYIPGLYMYFTAFTNGELGLGMAIAMILFIIVLALTLLQVKFIKPSTEFEA